MAAPKPMPQQEPNRQERTDDPINAIKRAKTGIRVVVTGDDSEPVAAVVPMADLERLEAEDRQRAAAVARLERIGHYFTDCDPDEVDREAIAAVAEIRARRRKAEPGDTA